jgi:hypothetical protein
MGLIEEENWNWELIWFKNEKLKNQNRNEREGEIIGHIVIWLRVKLKEIKKKEVKLTWIRKIQRPRTEVQMTLKRRDK